MFLWNAELFKQHTLSTMILKSCKRVLRMQVTANFMKICVKIWLDCNTGAHVDLHILVLLDATSHCIVSFEEWEKSCSNVFSSEPMRSVEFLSTIPLCKRSQKIEEIRILADSEMCVKIESSLIHLVQKKYSKTPIMKGKTTKTMLIFKNFLPAALYDNHMTS